MSEKGIALWNNVLSTTLRIPHVAVDRTDFLKKELAAYVNEEKLAQIQSLRPWNLVSDDVLEKIAVSCINSTTFMASGASFVAGLPGGFAMAATIPADMVQYYYHTVVLAQKISYLYGFPNLVDENGDISDSAVDLLTVYLGVTMGAGAASQGLEMVAKQLAKTAPSKIAAKALTKTFYYPIIKKLAPWFGVKMTKQTFAKGVGKAIPLLGGLISGGLTFASFKIGGNRLLKEMKIRKALFGQESMNENHGDKQIIDAEVINESNAKEL